MSHSRNYLASNFTDTYRGAYTLRTVLDTAPLTIEEVKTARGTIAYKFHARQDKRIGIDVLAKIEKALHNERARKGVIKSNAVIGAKFRSKDRKTYNAKKLEGYRAHRDEINQKRREKRAQQRQLKAAMQALPERAITPN